jgi:hypothetical protein
MKGRRGVKAGAFQQYRYWVKGLLHKRRQERGKLDGAELVKGRT